VIIYLPTQFALDLQLLGGLWILQTFPAVVFGLYTRSLRAGALLAGWAVGFIGGTAIAWSDGLKPLHETGFGNYKLSLYVGLLALVANIVTVLVVNAALKLSTRPPAQRSSPHIPS
jgi:SSS family solute:Na+ symporter